MQKPFATQPKLFVSGSDPGHPTLHALEDTEALLDWSEIERLLSTIYASKTGSIIKLPKTTVITVMLRSHEIIQSLSTLSDNLPNSHSMLLMVKDRELFYIIAVLI